MHLFAREVGCPVGSALEDTDWVSGSEPRRRGGGVERESGREGGGESA